MPQAEILLNSWAVTETVISQLSVLANSAAAIEAASHASTSAIFPVPSHSAVPGAGHSNIGASQSFTIT